MSITEISEPAYPNQPPITLKRIVHTVSVLFKLRVVSLLLLAAIGGAFLGADGWPGWANFGLLCLTGSAAAAGASAINQYWEREKDRLMTRTSKRPLVDGTIQNPQLILWIALGLILVPSLAVMPFNLPLGAFLLLGAFIYVVIYTMWLKPRTALNIVIGGAAGSAAVLSGGAAVGAWQNPAVLTLAAVLFLWTPAHFWSLAILCKDDYTRADTPMLPVKTSLNQAAWWVFAHTLPTAFGALILAVTPELGWFYLVPVILATLLIFLTNIQLILESTRKRALRMFLMSNFYLMIVLLGILIDTLLPF
ncbi:MAG: heme o synthase [Ardenticatenaceae bacterium]|nr:heme o synthase [Ardenticatenaceae bacterium]